MKVPKYVIELMCRANYTTGGGFMIDGVFYPTIIGYKPNFTLTIYKGKYHQFISTFNKEIVRFKKWVEKNGGTCRVYDMPKKTHYNSQHCNVEISENIMPFLREYINDKMLVYKYGSYLPE